MRPDSGALLELARWPNAVLAAAGVIAGAAWAAGDPLARPALWAAGSALGLTVLANAFNDARDVGIDRVAHPERPIPRGAATPRQALVLAAIGGIAGIALAFMARRALGWLSIVVAVAMVLYSMALKRAGLAGNVVVAVLASLPFLYGAWSVGAPARAGPLLLLAIPLHFAREVAKDVDDAAADAAVRRTLPLTRGPASARRTVVAATTVFALAAALAAWRWPALTLPAVLALVPAAMAAVRALRGEQGAPVLLKTAMAAALAGIALSLVP